MAYVDRVKREAREQGWNEETLSVGLGASYPALAEYMVCQNSPGIGARKTATLLLFVEEGVWKACLFDRDNMRKLWRAGHSFTDLLVDLEASLAHGASDWRWEQEHGKKNSRKGG